nr:MAG: ORF1 [Torque teno midi virus]
MPFWWNRRRKPWYGRRFTWRRRRRWRNKRRKPYTRRRYRRRPRTRRRRRRYRKVRRKRQTIPIRQWQPDSITKCKIKGVGCMILGGDGRQMYCYTDEKTTTVPPRTPCGGGFGVEVFTLKYLYEEYRFHNNIWTKTNIYKDLCRYLYCKFTFYRHQYVDFVISYDRQPPFDLNKLTYISCHPHQLLQHKHKRILLSKESNPNGKLTKKFLVKPPKQMISKWFFSQNFCTYPLVEFRATSCDFRYSYLGCCNENQQLGIYYLNQDVYKDASWGKAQNNAYKPMQTITTNYQAGTPASSFPLQINPTNYDDSVSIEKGWFQPKFLQITSITTPAQANIPVNTTLYNPNLDSGEGNILYLTSIVNQSYDPPQTDSSLTIVGLPLWLAVWGFYDYIAESKKTKEFWYSHCVMFKSKALIPYSQTGFHGAMLPLDKSFIDGKSAYGQPPTYHAKKYWYPTMEHQIETLNSLAECGPFVPKFRPGELRSTWELKYSYNFCFKWGGPLITDAEVADPCKQGKYDVPDTLQGRIQIQNPEKLSTESLIHPWDIRRGIIKEKALKRMYDNLSIDTAFQAAGSQYSPPPKKRYLPKITAREEENQEILNCLRSLCEENTCQETQEENLHILIEQQKQQQLKLKRNLLQLLTHLKEKQQQLQLQTGILE